MHTQSFICGVTVGACGVAICYRLVWHQRGAAAGKAGVSAPAESTIRLMTRLAIQHGAVNLSQGFPNEPPPRTMVLAAVGALLDGETLDSAEKCAKKLDALLPAAKPGSTALDSLNQYSYPFGVPMLRQAIQRYYGDFYPEVPADAEANLTVCLGATEGFAICLRAICKPEDTVAFFQPFHELYPNQCTIWGLTPTAVTLYESFEAARGWFFDEAEQTSGALKTLPSLMSPGPELQHEIFEPLSSPAGPLMCSFKWLLSPLAPFGIVEPIKSTAVRL